MNDKILVVEDDTAIQTVIKTYLSNAGFTVACIDNGDAVLATVRELRPDLVVLDLMLPGMDGTEVTTRLRAESDVYILILTARSEEADRVAGLRLGADDYLTKPFSPRELVARIEAILRRRREAAPKPRNELRFGKVRIAPDSMEVRVENQLLDLTTTEFILLLALARHPNLVLARDQIIGLVWGDDFFGTDRIVDVYVGQVRRKLEQAGALEMIQTVRGIGYKFVSGGQANEL